MKLPQIGDRQCGKNPLRDHRNPAVGCQRLTSIFSLGIVVAESPFRLSGIEPLTFQSVADSGRTNTRWVCPECGSWFCSAPRNGVIGVRAGTLDDTSWLRPTRRTLTRSKQPWTTFGAGDQIFPFSSFLLIPNRVFPSGALANPGNLHPGLRKLASHYQPLRSEAEAHFYVVSLCDRAVASGSARHSTGTTSSVHTVKLLSVFGPKVVLIATSAASRPRAINTRPMRGTLLRASKVYHLPPT